MTGELGVLIRQLAADPSKLSAITAEQERNLTEALRAVVGEGPVAPSATPAAPAPAWSDADLLTVDEAAARLRVSPRWLYRHSRNLPFSRKLSRKVLRFSRAGIAKWLATKRL